MTPGFVEADLVAHCGDRANGTFLNTLTITDIASGWTELVPLLRKSEADVQSGLVNIRSVLPFPILGLDTDNGSEFINYELMRFCETERITFTRARAYRKNDQAHVEEKNGSIVRRMTGYDRFEGLAAWRAMAALYAKVRLYVNFFQPSQKLLKKRRDGSKTIKQYDAARTPCQRLLDSTYIRPITKTALSETFSDLDPVLLLEQIRVLQDEPQKFAWQTPNVVEAPTLVAETIAKIYELQEPRAFRNIPINYRKSKRTRKQMAPRTYRTRKDAFEDAWATLKHRLELEPTRTAKDLLTQLIEEQSGKFQLNQRRTLQRRVLEWRKLQMSMESEYQKITLDATTSVKVFAELAELALSQ